MDFKNINGIEVSIEKKRIKNIHVRVHPPYGNVSVSAPMSMSDEAIIRFILSKEKWIKKHQETFQQQELLVNRYLSGEVVNVWGEKCDLTVLHSEHSDVIQNGNDVLLLIKKDSTFEERKKVMNDWYKRLLDDKIRDMSGKWEETIGVKSSGYVIKDMKTKWGTCNTSTNKICLNLHLAKKDPMCFEYVLVHELCHILEASHNQTFKSYLDVYLPNWRVIEADLNSQAIGCF